MSQQEKTLNMCLLMTPEMVNFSGGVHGGAILKLLDQVAYACAAKYSKSYVVTASLDQVFFKQPIKVGELVSFKAHINYVGSSSMEVGIKVIAENLTSHEKRHTTSCYFTMVAVDETGKPKKIPALQIENETEQRLFDAAKLRKQMRQQLLKQNRAMHVDITEDKL